MNIVNCSCIYVLKIYKNFISPILGNNCRYHPTCSSYCIEALKKYNIIYAFFLGFKRVMRCNPFGGSGYDPVP